MTDSKKSTSPAASPRSPKGETTTDKPAEGTNEQLRQQRLADAEKAADQPAADVDVGPQNLAGAETGDIAALARAAMQGVTQESTQSLADSREEADEDVVDMVELVVQIERDPMTKIPAKILAHELPILLAINGGDVTVLSQRDVEVTDFDPDDELDRLKRKYGSAGEQAILNIYGMDGSRIANEIGVKYQRRLGANVRAPVEAAMVRDHASAERTISTPRVGVRVANQQVANASSVKERAAGNRVSTRTSPDAASRRTR